VKCMNMHLAINIVLEIAKGHQFQIPWLVQIIRVFWKNRGLYTPPLFWPESSWTPLDSTYPDCQFFSFGMAGIVW